MDVPAVVHEGIAVAAKMAGFSNPRVRIESGSNPGDGYTSVVYRAIISKENGASSDDLRLICKSTKSDTIGNIMQFFFEAEAFFYNTLVPALEDVAKLQDPLPWPKCYVATASARTCLVMGDKCPERFRMADRRVPLDELHLHHALYQLGRFHGATMAMQRLRPAEFDAAAKLLTDPYRTDDVRNMSKSFFSASENTPEMMLERFPKGSEVHAKLERFFSTYADKFFNEIMTPGKGVGNTIIHADCHVNNMLFQYDEGGAVTGCCLIDFQTARFSTATLDVAMLCLAGTERAMRQRHLDGLLQHYHATLQGTLRAAGIADPDEVYSWEQFKAQFGATAGYGLYLAPWMGQVFEADPETVKDVESSVTVMLNESESSEAAAAQAAGGFRVKWSAEMRRRVGDLAEDMIGRGWL